MLVQCGKHRTSLCRAQASGEFDPRVDVGVRSCPRHEKAIRVRLNRKAAIANRPQKETRFANRHDGGVLAVS